MRRKKIACLLLAGMMLLSVAPTQAFAATKNSTAAVTAGDAVTTDGSQACEVDVRIASTFSVTVPKKITLDGTTKSGAYTVSCKGDIAGNESVSVVPDTTFEMSQTGKANVQAAVTQEKTTFKDSGYTGELGDAVKMGTAAGESTGTAIDGSIVTPDLSAGAWNGAFNFTINLEVIGEDLTLNGENIASYTNAETGQAIATSGDVVIPEYVRDADGVKHRVTVVSGVIPERNGDGVLKESPSNLFGKIVYDDENNTTSESAGVAVTSISLPDSVTNIGEAAFAGCGTLKSISIPDSVTNIGGSAFVECSSLTSITVNPNNTVYDSREGCNAIIETTSNMLIQGCNDTIIPDTVTGIGDAAFYGCSSLDSVDIPDSVISIGEGAFCACDSLTSVKLPVDVASIGTFAFNGCNKLNSVAYRGKKYSEGSTLIQALEDNNVALGYSVFDFSSDDFTDSVN